MRALEKFKARFDKLPLAPFLEAKRKFEHIATRLDASQEYSVRRKLGYIPRDATGKVPDVATINKDQAEAEKFLKKAQADLNEALGIHSLQGDVRNMLWFPNAYTKNAFKREMN